MIQSINFKGLKSSHRKYNNFIVLKCRKIFVFSKWAPENTCFDVTCILDQHESRTRYFYTHSILLSLFSLPSYKQRSMENFYSYYFIDPFWYVLRLKKVVIGQTQKLFHISTHNIFFDKRDKICSRVWCSARFYHQSVMWTFVAHPYFLSCIQMYVAFNYVDFIKEVYDLMHIWHDWMTLIVNWNIRFKI